MIVVCGIIKKNNGIIVCQRKKNPYEDWWEFPGGKIEKNETKRQALIREIREELNIKIFIEKFLFMTKHSYNGLEIHLFCYVCRYLSGGICLTEHKSLRILRVVDMLRLNLLEGNFKVVKRLRYVKGIN